MHILFSDSKSKKMPTSWLQGEEERHQRSRSEVECDETINFMDKSNSLSENASMTVTKTVTSTGGARITTRINPEKGEESKGVERPNGLRLKLEEEIGVDVNDVSLDEFSGVKSGEGEVYVGDFKGDEDSETRKIEDVEMRGEPDLVIGKNGSNVGVDDVSLGKLFGAKSSESEGDKGTVETEKEFEARKVDCEVMEKESDIGVEEKGSKEEENNVLDSEKLREEIGIVEADEGDLKGREEAEMRDTEDVEKEGESDMRVEEKGSKEEEKKVLDSEKLKGSVGRWKLSFLEWLQLPENNPNVKQEKVDEMELDCTVKVKEQSDMAIEKKGAPEKKVIVKAEPNVGVDSEKARCSVGRWNLSFQEWLQLPENNPNVKQEKVDEMEMEHAIKVKVKDQSDMAIKRRGAVENETIVKTGPSVGVENKAIVKMEVDSTAVENRAIVKKEVEEIVCVQPISAVRPILRVEYKRMQTDNKCKPPYVKRGKIEEKALSTVVIEDGDYPEEPDWLLVGRSVVAGLSTTKGRKIESNEIVHFAFPDYETRNKYSSNRAANAAFSIVRFSTKRNGEIGRLTTEWANCLVPLVNSRKVKVLGRCIAAPVNLHTFQEIMLYVSFYIHHSVFTEGETSSWKLEPTQIDSTTYPLLQLFNLLKIKPFQKAEFTPEELDSRKRSLNLGGVMDEVAAALPMVKRMKGCQQYPEQNKDEQVISEASLNKIVGAADVYDLKEMDPPDTLVCHLRPYQKQALYWMSESEKGVDVEEAKKMLHPCWAAYHICDKRAPAIYMNNFSGEATTRFPAATQMARGGILADAMGLGKTVMTIALILARRGRGSPDDQEFDSEDLAESDYTKKKKRGIDMKVSRKAKGGTLIICPMALLSQWKDELETHSETDSISIFIHYGGGRSNDPKLIAEPDVVLTTYGVLTAAYKNDGENSIFHQVDWYRVVLDEAHTIKSSKTQGAQAAYTLSSYCRWCLTGTPLQNNLEDLYSLLRFLHVEPWCNWAWWHKLIQRPYENGDKRGLKLIKAILRPLMLRRTKETKDKAGRPILVLPPADIQIIECEQSEAEHDFYDALFRRSKVQFDQFVAQGKVLHNYANILELLLRLRQCCNHPFLVMSRGDTQEYADLNKLARKFLETNPERDSQKVPTRAYIEEVVEGLKKGENAECPICMESADDPVLTPCAHRMCRECLLSCWRSPTMGFCPICRQLLKKNELVTCPSENRFRIDVQKNWKESSKVTKLLQCLELIHSSCSGEKSIVFSQWTSFLDLLEIPLKRRKIGFLRFDGKLQQKQREKVLKEFNETREKTVLLMSLRAGGVGLNLTAASNVFLMDPWWNPAVEEQAIMRIHRIGQKRTVRVRRFIVKDTVEERMQQVQARKQHMIAGALTDEDVRSARLEELKMLFR